METGYRFVSMPQSVLWQFDGQPIRWNSPSSWPKQRDVASFVTSVTGQPLRSRSNTRLSIGDSEHPWCIMVIATCLTLCIGECTVACFQTFRLLGWLADIVDKRWGKCSFNIHARSKQYLMALDIYIRVENSNVFWMMRLSNNIFMLLYQDDWVLANKRRLYTAEHVKIVQEINLMKRLESLS